jgi:hypothetical protein
LGSNLAQHLPLPFDHVVRAWFYRLECQVVVDSRKSLLPDCASGLQPLRFPRRLRVASSKCWKSHVNTSLRYSAPALCGLVRGRPCRPPLRHEPSTSVSLLSPPVDIVSAPPWSDPVVPTRERHTLHHRTLCCVRESSPSGPLGKAWMLPDLICRTTSLGSRPPSAANYRVCLMINFKRVRPMTFKRRHTPSRQTSFNTSCYG